MQSKTWIALLPGSRRKELRLNLPAMLGAAERLGAEFEFVMPVASTLDEDWVRQQIASVRRNRATLRVAHICQRLAGVG